MIFEELASTIEVLAAPGRGILAADESTKTIAKRLDSIGVASTEENRRLYRELLFTTEGLNEFISGVILFEETLQQSSGSQTFPELLRANNIMPGIKVDKGLVSLASTDGEQVTEGLDGLAGRLDTYKAQGATFAKWRNVYTIGEFTPSQTAIRAGAENLARYAAICQSKGIVPIVEPEILINGDHTIEDCEAVTKEVLNELFSALFVHQVVLDYIVLKPSMVIAGEDCPEQNTPEQVAEATLDVFRAAVPAAVPTINFLSGGQTPEQATENLNAMYAFGNQPWNLSFSYGRALQETCLKAWQGKPENVAAAQEELLKRSRLNGLASTGGYSYELEAD